MIKNSVVALVAAAALGGIALPAMAAPAPTEASAGFDADFTLTRLQGTGVNATAVEEWGTVLRAFVVLDDGTEVMQFFDPDTLAPVNL
jgi:hypothetical protein